MNKLSSILMDSTTIRAQRTFEFLYSWLTVSTEQAALKRVISRGFEYIVEQVGKSR